MMRSGCSVIKKHRRYRTLSPTSSHHAPGLDVAHINSGETDHADCVHQDLAQLLMSKNLTALSLSYRDSTWASFFVYHLGVKYFKRYGGYCRDL